MTLALHLLAALYVVAIVVTIPFLAVSESAIAARIRAAIRIP